MWPDVIDFENMAKANYPIRASPREMGEEEEGKAKKRGPADILPLFSPALFDYWQIILPRNRLVIYVREREL